MSYISTVVLWLSRNDGEFVITAWIVSTPLPFNSLSCEKEYIYISN